MSAKKVTDLDLFRRRLKEAAARIKHYALGPDHEVIEVPLDQWLVMFGDFEGRRVAETFVDGARVSTVFLGLDHSFGGPVPICFETMVFPNGESWAEVDMDRYATWDEAVEGHDDMVRKVRNKVVQFRRKGEH